MNTYTYTKKNDTILDNIMSYLNTQIVDDEELVRTVVMVALSAYTKNPINLMIKAPTSEGKTYAATKVLNLFPNEDVLFLGGMSPTALVHERGILVDEDNEPVEEKLEELNKKISSCANFKEKGRLEKERREILKKTKNLVDLSNKILLFLDTPNWELLRKLKPILSHDKEEIEFKITDKKNSSLQTKTTVVRGWPSVIYCSAKNEEKFQDWAEIQNRFIVKSPNTDVSKYRKANALIAARYGSPKFAQFLHNDEYYFENAMDDVRRIISRLQSSRYSCFNPFEQILVDLLPSKEGASMRLAEKFFALCNLETFVHAENRCVMYSGEPGSSIMARDHITDIADIENALATIDAPSILSPEKAKFVKDVLKPAIAESIDSQVTTAKLATKYNQVYGKYISPKQVLENYLEPLEGAGIVDWKVDPNDHRVHLYRMVSDVRYHGTDTVKSKIIDYSKNNPSFVESRIKELVDCSSEKAEMQCGYWTRTRTGRRSEIVIQIGSPEGPIFPTKNLQEILLLEPSLDE